MKKLLLTLLLVPMIGFGQNNYSINFDGQDDYLEFGNNLISGNNFSFTSFVKLNNISNDVGNIFRQHPNDGHWLRFLPNSSQIKFKLSPTEVTSNTSLNTNQWYHIATTYDGLEMKIYINGVLDASIMNTGGFINYVEPFIIGACVPCSAGEFFDGKIVNTGVWSIALTEQEIQQNMNCPPTGTEAGLVGYWNFEEGSGTTAFDLTSNGNDGTINGATYSTDVPVQNCCTPTSSTDVHTACESYSWIDGNTYTASNNSATYTTINAEGCDSTITLDLTITPQSTSSIIETACSFYTAPDDEVYTSTGNYTAIIDNAAGCDSVITIDLTINPTPSAAVTQNGATLTATQTGATYEWLDCDDESIIVGEINQAFTPAITGNYAVIVTIGDCFKKSECFLVDFTGIGELNSTPKQLIKIVDVLGRETPFKPNTPLLYIYNDGTVERKMIIEE